MTACHLELPYNFYSRRPLVARFSDLELSSDAEILLARQAEEQVQVCRGYQSAFRTGATPTKSLIACINWSANGCIN
jgi:hypothetical protein